MNALKWHKERFVFFDNRDKDIYYLKRVNKIAESASAKGHTPVGAILVDYKGSILLEEENYGEMGNALSDHTIIKLIDKANRKFDREYLNNCSIYSNLEPCCLCGTAIYVSNIGRIVYGAGRKNVFGNFESVSRPYSMEGFFKSISGQDTRKIIVEGPYEEVEDEIIMMFLKNHRNIWEDFKHNSSGKSI